MGTRQRHCAPRDLCAWLRCAPVPAVPQKYPKRPWPHFPHQVRFILPSVIFTATPDRFMFIDSSLHRSCLRTSSKGERDGRSRGMPSSGCATQNSKGLKTLGRDGWRQWTTTRQADDNGRCWETHKQETSRGVQAIAHCGSTAGQFALPSFCNDNFPIDSAEHNAPIPRLKVYLCNPSKCRGQGSGFTSYLQNETETKLLSNEKKSVLLLFHLEDTSDNTVSVHYVNISTMISSRTQIKAPGCLSGHRLPFLQADVSAWEHTKKLRRTSEPELAESIQQ